ncbi:MAG: hypothetical protein WCH78_06205 [Bacteroidota bacterium]
MYAIISWAYLFFFPLLMILILLGPSSFRHILLHLRAAVQFSLIIYAFYLIRQLIGLYQLRKLLNMPANKLDYFGSGLFEMGLIIVLPFLFLKNSILRTWSVGFVIWLLLVHSITRQGWNLQLDSWSFVSSLLFYISLITGIYALLWLLKKNTAASAI